MFKNVEESDQRKTFRGEGSLAHACLLDIDAQHGPRKAGVLGIGFDADDGDARPFQQIQPLSSAATDIQHTATRLKVTGNSPIAIHCQIPGPSHVF
jgi:hypothetical protein